jgi:hypothetical protein
MESKIVEAVDVIEAEVIASDSVQPESIQIDWIKPSEAQYQTGLNKTAFQKVIAELTTKYECPVQLLRRGEARNTEYSLFAVALIKSLKSGDKKALNKLLQFAPADEVSSALTITNKNNQVARQCDLAADENFKSAKANLNSGMANWRMLGGSLAKKVAKEIKAGFAEEFNAEMRDLGVQAQDVFDVEN